MDSAWGENYPGHARKPSRLVHQRRGVGTADPGVLNSAGQTLLTKESVQAVAPTIGKGSTAGLTDSPRELLGEGFALPEGFSFDDLHKEENIFGRCGSSLGCSWHA